MKIYLKSFVIAVLSTFIFGVANHPRINAECMILRELKTLNVNVEYAGNNLRKVEYRVNVYGEHSLHSYSQNQEFDYEEEQDVNSHRFYRSLRLGDGATAQLSVKAEDCSGNSASVFTICVEQ